MRDYETLDAAFGGSTDVVNVVVQAELSDDRTLRNLIEFDEDVVDDLRRPVGRGTGRCKPRSPVCYWARDDGVPGDRYDADFRAMHR